MIFFMRSAPCGHRRGFTASAAIQGGGGTACGNIIFLYYKSRLETHGRGMRDSPIAQRAASRYSMDSSLLHKEP